LGEGEEDQKRMESNMRSDVYTATLNVFSRSKSKQYASLLRKSLKKPKNQIRKLYVQAMLIFSIGTTILPVAGSAFAVVLRVP